MKPESVTIGQTAAASFPVGGGELGRLIRAFDWSKTSLGPIERWPPALRTATNIVLRSPLPLVMLWGPDGVMIYNDAYSEFAGQRHPGLLGCKVAEGWPEVAEFNAHILEVGLTGGTLSFKDQELTLRRNDLPEQVWMDLNYGPVLDDQGRPAGVLAIVVETTGRVNAERALAAQRAAVEEANLRLSAESAFLRELFEQAPSFMAMLHGPEHVFTLANAGYRALVGRSELIGLRLREAIPEAESQGFVRLLDEVYRTGEPFIARGLEARLQRTAGAPMEARLIDVIYQPVRTASGEIAGIFAEGQDVTERAAAEAQVRANEEHLRLVVNELNHRVKNNLAMIQAIAAQTFRGLDDGGAAQATFTARLVALARANDLLTGERWVGASLRNVLDQALEPYRDGRRMEVCGPDVTLSAKTALSLALATHELATNAVKHGAWSTPEGRVSVAWRRVAGAGGERLCLEWRESGGPPAAPPQRRGFGSRLIERGLAAEMGGEVRLHFEPAGVVCLIDAPLRAPDAE